MKLKELVSKYLNGSFKNRNMNFWIIQPVGRNKRLGNYNLTEIINKNTGLTMPSSVNIEAYLKYCALINELYDEVFKEDKNNRQPYKMEMLLFEILPEKIVAEISAYLDKI